MTKKTKEKTLVALDLGNNQIKIKTDKEEFLFPTAMLAVEDTSNESLIPTEERYSVFKTAINDNKSYYFGSELKEIGYEERWIRSIGYGLRRYNNETFKAMLTYALGVAVASNSAGMHTVDVVIGLPTSDVGDPRLLDDTEAKKCISDYLLGAQALTISGEKYSINVEAIKIVPQYFGTLVNLAYDGALEIKDERIISSENCIIDLGGGTVLGDIVNGLTLGGKKFGDDWGVADIIDELRTKVNNNYQKTIDANVLMSILKEGSDELGYHYVPGNSNYRLDLTTEVVEIRNQYTSRILAKMRTEIRHPEKLSAILITGGGANIIYGDKLKKEFPEVEIVKESELANVRGFYTFGKIFGLGE
ncbi:hypothetical protein ACFSJM_06665 [Lactococcus formosensis subsp. bovis]|uniref:ParM/StbA family protein n=1 Tax=Lactococcus formosensis TaxID=1281486 RepID=UPI001BCD8160|nr:ParM/StbA family protein [Lactococcus formosensis]